MTFQPLTIESAADLAYTIEARMARGDDLIDAVLTVLLNAGDRFAVVQCVAGEWSGTKAELEPGPGIPKCPNGHVLTQGPAPRLGYAP